MSSLHFGALKNAAQFLNHSMHSINDTSPATTTEKELSHDERLSELYAAQALIRHSACQLCHERSLQYRVHAKEKVKEDAGYQRQLLSVLCAGCSAIASGFTVHEKLVLGIADPKLLDTTGAISFTQTLARTGQSFFEGRDRANSTESGTEGRVSQGDQETLQRCSSEQRNQASQKVQGLESLAKNDHDAKSRMLT